ncbi:MAG: hypothetical protein AB7U61_10295 [Methylocystis sp.]
MLEGFWAAGTLTFHLVMTAVSLLSGAVCLAYLWSLVAPPPRGMTPPVWHRSGMMQWAGAAILSNLYVAAERFYTPGASALVSWLLWLDLAILLIHAAIAALGVFAFIVALGSRDVTLLAEAQKKTDAQR